MGDPAEVPLLLAYLWEAGGGGGVSPRELSFGDAKSPDFYEVKV